MGPALPSSRRAIFTDPPRAQFDQYAFTLNTSTNITFSLTVIAGDPDAYIGTNSYALPNSTWGSYNVS